MDGMCCSWKQDCPHTYWWGSANLQKVHTTILWCNLLLQQSDEMMSGAAFPVHLIQMKLFLCVFLSRKSACKEDRSLTKQTTFKSSMTTARSTGRGLILPILRKRRRGSSSKRVLLVACQNCTIVIFCCLCLPLLLSVCFWLLLFVSSASDYSLLSLLLAWHFFLNP